MCFLLDLESLQLDSFMLKSHFPSLLVVFLHVFDESVVLSN
jgi:hypothetical protein